MIRADHNLQDVRAKIFPYKRRKVEAPEVVTPVTLPAKRKERSLSSLVVSTPRVSTYSGMTGRRSKSVARKASKGSIFTIEKSPKKCEVPVEDHPESSSAPLILNKFSQGTKLVRDVLLKLIYTSSWVHSRMLLSICHMHTRISLFMLTDCTLTEFYCC